MKPTLTALWSAAVSAVTFLLMHYYIGPRLPVNAVEVPPLVGLSPEQARGLLEPRGLLLVLDGERADPQVAAGSLSEQRPLGGSRLRRGDEVHSTLARPAAAPEVPVLSGATVEAAKAALEKARLKVGRVGETASDSVQKGMVVGTNPPAGASAQAGALVDVTVSSGPATTGVPSLVGKSLSSAKRLLESSGFAVGGTRYGSHDDYETGVVIRQNPQAGAQATPGVKIDLVIND